HFVATELSTSPWSRETLHGGPVGALLARQLEQWPTELQMFPARLTLELLRPMTFDPFGVHVREFRPGRKVQVLEALVYPVDEGLEPSNPPPPPPPHQTRAADVPAAPPAAAANGVDMVPPPPEAFPPSAEVIGDEGVRFHNSGVEHRTTSQLLNEPGPATDW